MARSREEWDLIFKHSDLSDQELEKTIGFLSSLPKSGLKLEQEEQERLDELLKLKAVRSKHPRVRANKTNLNCMQVAQRAAKKLVTTHKRGQKDFDPTNMNWVKQHLGQPSSNNQYWRDADPDKIVDMGSHYINENGDSLFWHSHEAHEAQPFLKKHAKPHDELLPRPSDFKGKDPETERFGQKLPNQTKTNQTVVDGVPTAKAEYKLNWFAEADTVGGSVHSPSYYAERIVQALRYYGSGDPKALYDNVVASAKREGMTDSQQDAMDTLLVRWNVPIPVNNKKLLEDPYMPGKSDLSFAFNQKQVAAQKEWVTGSPNQILSIPIRGSSKKATGFRQTSTGPEALIDGEWYSVNGTQEEITDVRFKVRQASTSFPFKSVAAVSAQKEKTKATCDEFIKCYAIYKADPKKVEARFLRGQLDNKVKTLLKNNFSREEIAKEIPNWSFPEEIKTALLKEFLPKKIALSGPRIVLSNERAVTKEQRHAQAVSDIAEHAKLDELTKEQQLRISALKSKYRFSTAPWIVKAASISKGWEAASDSTDCECGHAAVSHQQHTKKHECTLCPCTGFDNATLNDKEQKKEAQFVKEKEEPKNHERAMEDTRGKGADKWINDEDKNQKKVASQEVEPGWYAGRKGMEYEWGPYDSKEEAVSCSEDAAGDDPAGMTGIIYSEVKKPDSDRKAIKVLARLEDGRVLEATIQGNGECQTKAGLDYNLKKAIRKADSFEEGWVHFAQKLDQKTAKTKEEIKDEEREDADTDQSDREWASEKKKKKADPGDHEFR